MNIALFSRLKGLHRSGPGRWKACCPAHADKSPSLTITEKSDGMILMHCFAGCSVSEILAALDLDIGDLFPPAETKRQRGYLSNETLRRLYHEALIIGLSAIDVKNGKPLSPTNQARLIQAIGEIGKVTSHGNY